MNGLYSSYMGFPSAPRQNVQQYVNAPVMSVPAQSQQPQVTMADFLRAMRPKQDQQNKNELMIQLMFGNNANANLQPQQEQPSKTELMIQRMFGYKGNTTS